MNHQDQRSHSVTGRELTNVQSKLQKPFVITMAGSLKQLFLPYQLHGKQNST
jgi:hypothetical protein